MRASSIKKKREFQPINAERMIGFRNHHFAIPNEIVDIGKDHQRMLTVVSSRERSIENLKMDGSG